MSLSFRMTEFRFKNGHRIAGNKPTIRWPFLTVPAIRHQQTDTKRNGNRDMIGLPTHEDFFLPKHLLFVKGLLGKNVMAANTAPR